ncbi:permease prefix domain 1-containing protein [Nonomuraea sp. NPDC049421]|uniref:permease prefix domain 1-containing protein n=1 Tax=Nonomuraea sp. NPDC049421 TaxID=3155275 RepID=UPI00342EAA34
MLIDDYVAELDRAVCGPPGPKHDLVVEARDSLLDTAEAFEAEGLDRAEAERRAVEEFGEVAEIAPGFQLELTAASGRRLGMLLFVSVPITVAMWSLLWRLYPADASVWLDRPGWYVPLSRLLDVLQLGTGLYGGLVVFALSRGARWIRRPRLAVRSMGILVWTALPLTGVLAMVLSFAVDAPNSLDSLPALLANLVTSAMWGLQLYGAARCVRVTRA